MRKVHFVLSVLVLAAVVLQFYLAGVGVFSMPEDELFDLHTTNGRITLPVLLLLNLVAAALARGRTLRYALGLVGLLALQTVIFVIATGGVNVFPRLVSAEHRKEFKREVLQTESAQLNALLGGGVERGSSVLILGPAGTGKSLLALTFVAGAVGRGENAAMFVFDEELGLLFERAKGLGIDIQAMIDSGRLAIEQIDAAEMTPGELLARVRRCVEEQHARTVVIDSLNGYQAAMPEEQAPILHMHELLQYLNRQGASTFLTVAQHGLVGDMKAPVDVTYLADTVILLRYFEALGRVRRAVSVIKKRTGAHEDTIREYRIDGRGITLGEPLVEFQGVLRGVPELLGETQKLLESPAK